ncbi:MAG: MFS transporter [Rhodospirillaceae bacterium]|nr:MFS transporter [Rhodospirillaceae bacterium]
MSETDRTMPGAAPSIYPVVRLITSLVLVTMGGAAMYGIIVVLKPVSIEFGVGRGVASLPYFMFMIVGGIGGVVMGRLADRFGVLVPALIGCVGLPAGMAGAAFAEEFWQFCVSLGVLSGLLGTSALFAPMAADISHWFTRRRGLAVAIVITGTYFAGALWPPIVQASLDARGWRETFVLIAILMAVVMLPLVALLYRKPASLIAAQAALAAPGAGRPLGVAPGTLQCLICAAGLGCCVAMAAPQVHIVAHVTDLGYAAQHGAAMLSVMLGTGIVSRIGSGFISDRIGGLRTLLLGSVLQALALAAFLGADTLTLLFVVSAVFGLSQGGIVPSYTIIIRTFFPAHEAGRRVGWAMLFTFAGMALGGWMAGALYDLTGSYTASFINAVAFNVLNAAIVVFLARRHRALATT